MATAARTVYSHITKAQKCVVAPPASTTRAFVIDVVRAKNEGYSPEQLRDFFAVKLTLAQVYSALAYADENYAEIEADSAEQARIGIEGERARSEHLKRHSGR